MHQSVKDAVAEHVGRRRHIEFEAEKEPAAAASGCSREPKFGLAEEIAVSIRTFVQVKQ
jgi:hypothetical protein